MDTQETTPHYNGQYAELKELMGQQKNVIDELVKKVDRQTTELVALRSEVGSIRTRVCGEVARTTSHLPLTPFKSLEEFMEFEQTMEEDSVLKCIIADLLKSSEVSCDKFVRCSWRLLMTDEVARQCSWRDSDIKKCVRGLRSTLALRTAFKQRFALEDTEFERVTQNFFQYAKTMEAKKPRLDMSIDLALDE